MASSSSSPSPASSSSSPCAACKFLRRKCMPGCIFAPYFPPEEPLKFANVHKVFGASNVTKLLNELLPCQREDAINSLAYEAEARVKDPVYGCVGAISVLQRQVHRLQKELDAANADLLRYACSGTNDIIPLAVPSPTINYPATTARIPYSLQIPYSLHQWAAASVHNSNAGGGSGGGGESNANNSAGGGIDVDHGEGGESNM